MATEERVIHGPDGHRQETYLERLDRNLVELVSELRVAQTGVQILFAFLLIVPFSNRFPDGDTFDRLVYVVTLLLTGASAGLLIAPSSYHRLLFRRNDKRYLVFTANQLMIAGLGCLALAMTGGVLLVTHVLLGLAAAVPISACVLLFFAALWYGVPLRRRRTVDRGGDLGPPK
jgi:Family of unknown function (DUF6328)